MQIIYTFLAGIMPSTTGIKLSPNSLGPWFSIIYNSIYPSSACDYSAKKKKKKVVHVTIFGRYIWAITISLAPKQKNKKKIISVGPI